MISQSAYDNSKKEMLKPEFLKMAMEVFEEQFGVKVKDNQESFFHFVCMSGARITNGTK